LLKRLREARAAEVRRPLAPRDKAEVEAYPAKLAAWNGKVKVALVKIDGKPIRGMESYRENLTVPVKVGPTPSKPTTSHICKYDRAIEVVSLTKADVFRLRTDDPMLGLIVPDRC